MTDIVAEVPTMGQPQTRNNTEPAKPDHWLTMADELRQVADRIATLAGTPTPPVFGPYVSIYSNYNQEDGERSTPIVDALASAFGVKAETKTEGRGRTRTTNREMRTNHGKVRLVASARIPNPPTRQEKVRSRAELEAKVAELEAQIAQSGGGR
ncbi:hypothetical protein GA0070622_0927 [Micromonospora sediminicola]|uniref:Uncharacterized protein n=1 Tax=Micromonospora sediminicola TaxID=946078 RepID=A0A1A9B4K7_9ACTN|nr:hypothetical protein [Micromonospora sediminicola]SBT63959.1 hypothetical protein GA0070622_0927 [Micromonospora sediminicola]